MHVFQQTLDEFVPLPSEVDFATGHFSKLFPENRIFQNLADSMSSGMQNAQNFAAVVSSMVLEPSFFDNSF